MFNLDFDGMRRAQERQTKLASTAQNGLPHEQIVPGALIAAGAPIYLAVLGVSHPPVALFVGNPPTDTPEPPHAR